MTSDTKKCVGCKRVLHISLFISERNGKELGRCAPCANRARVAYRAKRKEAAKREAYGYTCDKCGLGPSDRDIDSAIEEGERMSNEFLTLFRGENLCSDCLLEPSDIIERPDGTDTNRVVTQTYEYGAGPKQDRPGYRCDASWRGYEPSECVEAFTQKELKRWTKNLNALRDKLAEGVRHETRTTATN